MNTFVNDTEFVVETCCNCHMQFAITRQFFDSRRKDREWFSCPAGHRQHYTGQSEETKLRNQLANETRQRESAEAQALYESKKRHEIERAHLRMRTRVMNGVCPCCNRTFQNLLQHMRTEHAGEVNLKNIRVAYGMTQTSIANEIGVNTSHVSLFEREKPIPKYAKTRIETWIASQDSSSAEACK